ncbi:DUF1254 domain-containing protein [Thalassotalea sp. PS06]|uniref:DUF1254 domain-containing protein n=1 Tax=Thalassotalea sp. PS06 TaxID=2594005 RepID=UPI00163D9C1D|nr:DUF1254 domain-containing protein [Thalassotalea sp. PS06]
MIASACHRYIISILLLCGLLSGLLSFSIYGQNQPQQIDDSEYFTFTRIYHGERVIQHLRQFGANRFATPVSLKPVDFTVPGTHHLVAIADLNVVPAVITLPEQFGPYRSLQIIDLNYQQIFYQLVTEGSHKFVLSHQNHRRQTPQGKTIISKSRYVMVVLRTLSGYPKATYSEREVRRQISLSGFSEGIIRPSEQKQRVSSVLKPQETIQWLREHHDFGALEDIWLEMQQQTFNDNSKVRVLNRLQSTLATRAHWHNVGLMTSVSDSEQVPHSEEALSLLINYPSVNASNRLETASRIEMDERTSLVQESILSVDPAAIAALFWGIDALPKSSEQHQPGYHSYNTSKDYQGQVNFALINYQSNQHISQHYRNPGYPIVFSPEQPFIRSYYYQPQVSLVMTNKQRNTSPQK